jgi:site-specific DNA-methyltransferase (adenine-specific)
MAGGRGLGEFRKAMLDDRRISVLVDYIDSRFVFPRLGVAGGVCYFLWDAKHHSECSIVEHDQSMNKTKSQRYLREVGLDVFVRSSVALGILRKIADVERSNIAEQGSFACLGKSNFSHLVSAQKPFGLRTNFRGAAEKSAGDVLVIQAKGSAWTSRSQISQRSHLIDKWKVFTAKSSSEHAGQPNADGQRRVLSRSGVLPPGAVVTESYVAVGPFDTELEARNCASYMATRFFRYLVSVRSSSQDLPRSSYEFVPILDFSETWTDAKLYERYGLTTDEIASIENAIASIRFEQVEID